MKINEDKLKRIIKEELTTAFNEVGIPMMSTGMGVPGGTRGTTDPHTAALNNLQDYIYKNYKKDTNLIGLIEEVQQLVADFENKMGTAMRTR